MRLIDADKISYCNYDLDNYHSFQAVTDDEIAEMPTVDAEVVVRCKDCKHWWKVNKLCVHPKCCEGCVSVVEAPADHYCGYGERRTDV